MSDDFENGPEASPAPEAAAEAPGTDAAASPDDFDWDELRNEFDAKTAKQDTAEAEPVFDFNQFANEQALQQRASEIDGYANQLNEVAAQIDYAQDKLRVDQLVDRLSKANADFARQDRQVQLGILSSIWHASEAARQVWLNGDETTQKTLEREVARYIDRMFGEVADHAKASVIDENATQMRESVAAAVRWASSHNPPPAPAKNFGDMSESEFRREVTRATGISLD